MPGAGDVNLDPGFANTTARDPQAFHLLATSPLVDAGDPAPPVTAESTLDLDGNPRFVDGHGRGTAIGDVGAFEFQALPPTVHASASPTLAMPGTPVTFTGSATDPDPGDVLTLSWSIDDGVTGSGSTFIHAFATTGVHTATLTVTDLDGHTVNATTQVTVSAPPPPPPPSAKPAITNLRLRPSSFPAAVKGASVARSKPTGTLVSYSDSLQATTTFMVQRAVFGRLQGAACRAKSKRNRHHKRCTLYVAVGSFTHSDVAGPNGFHFTGRVAGRALRPGGYLLQAIANNSSGVGAPTFAAFKIVR
jgi:hypothetical protein